MSEFVLNFISLHPGVPVAFIRTKFVPLDLDLGCFNWDPGEAGRPYKCEYICGVNIYKTYFKECYVIPETMTLFFGINLVHLKKYGIFNIYIYIYLYGLIKNTSSCNIRTKVSSSRHFAGEGFLTSFQDRRRPHRRNVWNYLSLILLCFSVYISIYSCSSKSDIGPIQLHNDFQNSNSLVYDGVRLKWSSDLDSLKKKTSNLLLIRSILYSLDH